MPHKPKILLFGQNGQVAHELQRTLATLGEVIVASRGSDQVRADLTDIDSVRSAIRKTRPTYIVNAAAYTAVDAAETDREIATRINGEAPGVMAEAALETDALLVHFSTDYVFDGSSKAPYNETDPTAPLGVYGETKLEGERAIRQSGSEHLIFRTAWVYGTRGKNFLCTIRRLAGEREELKVVDDQIGSPTWSRSIAEATAQVLAMGSTNPEFLKENSGIYHLTSQAECSWFDFAQAIVAGIPKGEKKCQVIHRIPSSEFQTPAPRPAYSVLAGEKLKSTFNIHMPDWQGALSLCVGDA